MNIVSFMDIEETDKDLIISFAIDNGDGYIKTLLLHRTLLYEFLCPDEERGTKVSLEGEDLNEDYINTLKCVTFDATILKIKSQFSFYEVDLRKLQTEEIEQTKKAIIRHNFDDRFEVKFT
jgi:hypothetical protein